MTDTRFVIPAGADPASVAWPGYRPETWAELADETPIENAGSDWCVAHGIDGLGFVTVDVPPVVVQPSAPEVAA